MILKEAQLLKQADLDKWYISGCAPIVTAERLIELVNPSYLVCTSGGYDPIHPGHISCMVESKKLNKILAVIVNGDWFLTNKKGKAFQDLRTRCQIVSSIGAVDYVVPYEIEGETTVSPLLELIRPWVFTKGGDRVDEATIPEWETCELNDIKVITGVGIPKRWSSSDVLAEWTKFKLDQSA